MLVIVRIDPVSFWFLRQLESALESYKNCRLWPPLFRRQKGVVGVSCGSVERYRAVVH